ncbi:Protein kinase domain-containing protein [Caenorhabditis elegans]|uniref:Protein kinase domain-containing protein n=1 Tax=Caenorhabditis elegans TaxID=6239 RepID=Q93453_CAEEL|nr:Protein kinase domain-containing protein [Caenorhabditis elegans]CAB02279.2 Protein kinase domain-containing protein [Caenorhabditis elegans]|eukprot:NP_492648.2 Uncharacterized protein CELE_F10G8.2 [Caenorhabditis elegans]
MADPPPNPSSVPPNGNLTGTPSAGNAAAVAPMAHEKDRQSKEGDEIVTKSGKKYKLGPVLGEGGYGTVFLSQDDDIKIAVIAVSCFPYIIVQNEVWFKEQKKHHVIHVVHNFSSKLLVNTTKYSRSSTVMRFNLHLITRKSTNYLWRLEKNANFVIVKTGIGKMKQSRPLSPQSLHSLIKNFAPRLTNSQKRRVLVLIFLISWSPISLPFLCTSISHHELIGINVLIKKIYVLQYFLNI